MNDVCVCVCVYVEDVKEEAAAAQASSGSTRDWRRIIATMRVPNFYTRVTGEV